MADLCEALLATPPLGAARRHIERCDETTLARQAALSAIPAPTGAESARAARVAELLDDAGLDGVSIDAVGNVRGWYGHGSRETAETEPGCVILSAHLDTVFGPELDVSVARRGPRLEGPGISDNARGLAALVTIAEALAATRVATGRPILFAATVGEEGHGNLRGVRHLFAEGGPAGGRPHAFIALDGAGVERIVHRALGSRRYRVTYRGPGGHSWSAFGVANPAAAVGRAAALLAEIPTGDASPRATCAVVRLGGGTGLNSIPQEAFCDLDLRSEDARALEWLDGAVQAALTR
ncbi:MAG: M20/M25/M40 family metallo-hydrolase, partial [Gemmatimonadales bacterium]